MQLTNEMVALAAQELYHTAQIIAHTPWYGTELSWSDLPKEEQNHLWNMARLALERAIGAAVLSAREHLCNTCSNEKMCWRRLDIEDACDGPLTWAKAVIVQCDAYVADKRVEEVLDCARQGSASQGQ